MKMGDKTKGMGIISIVIGVLVMASGVLSFMVDFIPFISYMAGTFLIVSGILQFTNKSKKKLHRP